jgi:tetratricopeptide (TPR) repeat protein
VLNNIANGKSNSFEDALAELGQSPDEPETKLGDLLVESGLITKQQLQSALGQSEETGLPFGRLLVLGGTLTEQMMTAALNAQSALASKKTTREQAIKSLRSSVRRTGTNQTAPAERDFYQLPDRKSVLLGELLVDAGSISKAQLNNAIEISINKGQSLGQVLQELKLISETVLKHTLEVQEMVMANKCSTADAAKIVQMVDRDKLPMAVALQRIRLTAQLGPDKKVSFIEFLKLLGVVDDDAINKALNMGRENAHVMMQLLLFAKVCDPNFLHLAASCNAMMESGRLTVEHAFVLFDYARKKRVNIEQALKELNWGQGDISHAIASANAGTEWEILRKQSEQSLLEGKLEAAEKQWLEVVKKAEALGGKEGPRFVSSIERLADVYAKQGRLAQAEALYSEALVTKTRVLPPHSLHTAASVNNMAKISYFQGKYDDAERFALRFLELYKANFPSHHPDVACALQNVATLYHMQDKYHLAEPYYTEAIRICKSQLGEGHATTIRMNQNYARLLQQMKRFREADKVDAKVQGSVTGSWKAVAVPSDHLLYNLGEKNDQS